MAKFFSRRAATAASVSLIALAGAALGVSVMATAEAQQGNLTPALTAGVAPGAVPSFADLIEHVSPAVVAVDVTAELPSPSFSILPEDLPPGYEDFFEFFRRSFPQQEAPQEPRQAFGAGSGFFISPDGLIVTNHHVVAEATEIKVTLQDGRELDATVVGTDEPTDLALLRVEGSDFPYVQFDRDPNYRVGDWVVAVGNPYGLSGTATAGIISAVGREEPNARYNAFIQIDAPINRGNSGGPTFDLEGNVIGVNSQIYSPTGGNIGIGFAIPSDVAASVVDQLAETGTVTRGWLGVSIQDVNEDLADAFGVEPESGAVVSEVTPDSPAETAGIQAGDIILAVDGDAVSGATELTRRVGSLRAGQTYTFDVLRDGRRRNIDVAIGVRPPEDQLFASEESQAPATPKSPETVQSAFGLSLAPLTAATRSSLNLGDDVQGVVVMDVAAGSAAAERGFQRGIVIRRVDGRAVSTPQEFEAAIESARNSGKGAVALLVRVEGRDSFVAMPLEEESDAG